MHFSIFTLTLYLLLGLAAPFKPDFYTEVEFPKLPIRIEAHRGAGRLAAENTREAFEMAIELGIDGIEIDVWLSKDKVPIVVHGLLQPHKGFVELENQNEKQNISEIDAGNLKNYTLKNGEKILTLAETLDICKDQISLNIEFKDWREEVVDRVLDVLQEKNMLGQVSFSSFDHSLRKRLTNETARRKIEPMSFGYISSSLYPRFPNYTTTCPGDTINMDVRFLEKDPKTWSKHLNQAKEHGLMVKIWFPVIFESEIEYYEELMKAGVNTIITNEPSVALDYFESERLIALLM